MIASRIHHEALNVIVDDCGPNEAGARDVSPPPFQLGCKDNSLLFYTPLSCSVLEQFYFYKRKYGQKLITLIGLRAVVDKKKKTTWRLTHSCSIPIVLQSASLVLGDMSLHVTKN